MYKLLIIICLYLTFGESRESASSDTHERKNTTLVITLQDNFRNDEVGLNLNKKDILKGEVLTSSIVGYTDIEVVFCKYNQKEIVTTYGGDFIKVPLQQKMFLIATLNGKKNYFVIDLKLGKYVGLSKKERNQIYIRQSKIPFIYD